MLCQPSSSIWPHSEIGSIYRTTSTPQIRIVMSHPATCSVNSFSSFLAIYTQIAHHIKKRLVVFRQVCYFGRPVIHFRININRIFTIPRSIYAIAPQALQIGGLSTGLRRRNKQITTILKHQCYKVQVFSFTKSYNPFISLQRRCFGRRYGKRHTIELLLIGSYMIGKSLLIRNFYCTFQNGRSKFRSITAHIMIVYEVCRSRYVKSSHGSLVYNHRLIRLSRLSIMSHQYPAFSI